MPAARVNGDTGVIVAPDEGPLISTDTAAMEPCEAAALVVTMGLVSPTPTVTAPCASETLTSGAGGGGGCEPDPLQPPIEATNSMTSAALLRVVIVAVPFSTSIVRLKSFASHGVALILLASQGCSYAVSEDRFNILHSRAATINATPRESLGNGELGKPVPA